MSGFGSIFREHEKRSAFLIGILSNKNFSRAWRHRPKRPRPPKRCSVSHTQKPGRDSEIDAGEQSR